MSKKNKKPRHCKSEELKGLYFRYCVIKNALWEMKRAALKNRVKLQKKTNG